MSGTVTAGTSRFTADTRLERSANSARNQLVAWAEIVALVLIAVALVAATLTAARRPAAGIASERVRVEAGQTLWNIATQHPIAGLSTEQTAELIASLNRVDDGRLVAGMTIRIPREHSNNLTLASR